MQVTLPKCDVLCVYGFPDPQLFEELEDWLSDREERFLVILEDEEQVLLGSEAQENIRICFLGSDESLKTIAWELVFLNFDYLDAPGNSLKSPEKMKKAFEKMRYFQEGVHLVASDFQNKGLDHLANCLENSKLDAKLGRSLFGKFQGIPAVICGGGVSLEDVSEKLKTVEDRALIFAGGSALASLSKLGIRPHFAGFVDPHPLSERYFENTQLDTPLLYTSRAQCGFTKQMNGMRFLFPSVGEDFIERWIYKDLGESIDAGWNVVTFLASVAKGLGCSPIIFAGVDLCQDADKAYAGDLESDVAELIPCEVDGTRKYTKRDFLFAADWLREFIEDSPDREWLNLTKGGLPIGARPIDELPHIKQRDLRALVHSIATRSETAQISHEKEELTKSFERAEKKCSQMLEMLEKSFPNSPEKNGSYTLCQVELEEEPAFEGFLAPVWDVWKHSFLRKIPKGVPEAFGIGMNKWLFMKEICENARKI